MAKIIIERGSSYWGGMRSVLIEVDGKRCAKVSRNSRVEFAVDPGTHTIQARMGWVKSSPIKVMINLNDVVGFACEGWGSSSGITLKKAFHKSEPERAVTPTASGPIATKRQNAEVLRLGAWFSMFQPMPRWRRSGLPTSCASVNTTLTRWLLSEKRSGRLPSESLRRSTLPTSVALEERRKA